VKLSSRMLPLAAGACALSLAGAALGHHSTAMFDMQRPTTVAGVVKQFDWTNPHTFIWIDVQESGSTVEYSFEGMSPNYLSRNGWSHSTLKPGEAIVLQYFPLKDGRKGGFCARVKLPGGQLLDNLPRGGGAPPPGGSAAGQP
jgi:hypothetical protein